MPITSDPAFLDGVVTMYGQNMSLRAIAHQLGCSARPVVDALKARGVARRPARTPPATFRADAFLAGAPEDAYWLGLLFADGWVSGAKIGLGLHHGDADHVAAFARFIGTSNRVARYRDQVCVSLGSPELAGRLRALGMGAPRRPHLAPLWSPDFWRGMVDGDGSVLRYPHRGLILRLNGTLPIVAAFLAFVKKGGHVTRAIPRRHSSIWRATLGGEVAEQVVNRLYLEGRPALRRKHATAMTRGQR